LTARRKPLASSVAELALICAVAVALALGIQAVLVKPYRIPSESMLPTLHVNQRILVDRIGMHFGSPHVGDIVVFHPPRDFTDCADSGQGIAVVGRFDAKGCDVQQSSPSSQTFVKRVVGVGGDRLSIVDGHVIRNGKREADRYTLACVGQDSCDFPGTIVVPRGDFYMMGDNRPDSEDSRFWGPVPKSWIIGKAFFTYWPPDRVGTL
jgi:signal peptidase I